MAFRYDYPLEFIDADGADNLQNGDFTVWVRDDGITHVHGQQCTEALDQSLDQLTTSATGNDVQPPHGLPTTIFDYGGKVFTAPSLLPPHGLVKQSEINLAGVWDTPLENPINRPNDTMLEPTGLYCLCVAFKPDGAADDWQPTLSSDFIFYRGLKIHTTHLPPCDIEIKPCPHPSDCN